MVDQLIVALQGVSLHGDTQVVEHLPAASTVTAGGKHAPRHTRQDCLWLLLRNVPYVAIPPCAVAAAGLIAVGAGLGAVGY